MRARSLPDTRLTLLMLAVTGIVVGLLAMHTMSLSPSEGDHSTMTHAATSAAMDATTTTAASTTASTLTTTPMHSEPAGGDCGSDCIALQMTCVLSLLVIGAILLRPPASGHRLLASLPASVREHLTSRVPPRRTPSLDVLCISRT